MNRLYVFESTMTSTGAKADHRWFMRAAEVAAVCDAIGGKSVYKRSNISERKHSWRYPRFLGTIVQELLANRGTSLVIAGDGQGTETHAMAHAMNHVLGNVGATVFQTDPVDANPINQTESIKDLVSDIHAGKVDLLVILAATRPTMHPPISILPTS